MKNLLISICKEVGRFIVYTICYLGYPLSFLFVRNPKKYAFGSFRGSFNDNAKYLFIYTCHHHKDIDAVWLSLDKHTVEQVRSKGLKAYCTYTPKGIWHALTSRYWFFNAYTSDIMFCLSGGAICINLWHGVGIKRIEYNITTGPLALRYQKKDWKEVFFHPESFRKPNYVISSSPFQNHFFSTSFHITENRCLMTGYPRNTILLDDDKERMHFVEKYEPTSSLEMIKRLKQYKKVLVYMPTWRDSQRSLFVENMDLHALNEVLAKHNELLILKPHANVSVSSNDFTYSNICFFDGKDDIYPILPYTNVLITDYSSIIYDYLLMPDKDVILYINDYQEYVAMRDFFYPYDENVVGKRVHTFTELITCIEQHDYQLSSAERISLIDKFWGDTAYGNPSQRILEQVKSLPR